MDTRTERLKEAFAKSGMTQTELCKITGITKGALSSYLSGRYLPKQQAVEKLAVALNISVIYLMGWDDPSSSTTSTLASDSLETQILTAFHKLNDTGKHRAIQNVEDLTGNEKYTSQSYEEDKGGELLDAKVV